MAAPAEFATSWIADAAPAAIPDEQLARLMLIGTPTTRPDGSVVSDIPDGPQAHVAIQGGGTEPIGAHFHGVNQFQVFVRGSGSVGRHHVAEGTAHYADRYMVYGPLRPGPGGMAYLTLRPAHDTGASFMPGAREKLADLLEASGRSPSERRNLSLDLHDPIEEGTWHHLVAHDDGLRISVFAAGPGQAVETLRVTGAGAYALVAGGSLFPGEGGHAPTGSLRWLDPGSSIEGRAEADGARLVFLQFPA
jgi:hypothetical protein